MSRQLLHEVRDVLRAADAIVSEREFCERWLGKSECYMRTLRFSQIEPSADALATVGNKLKYYSEQMHSKDAQHLKDLGVWGFSRKKSYSAVSYGEVLINPWW